MNLSLAQLFEEVLCHNFYVMCEYFLEHDNELTVLKWPVLV